MRYLKGAMLAGAALLLAACAKEPEPPRMATVTVTGGADINASADGPATPVVVQLYELTQASDFEQAGFFDLYDNAQGTLGPDLVASERITLRPGQTVEKTWTLADRTGAVGAIAAFRALDTSTWRGSAPLGPAKQQAVTVSVNGTTISVSAE